MNVGYWFAAFTIERYVVEAEVVESLLLNVFQSVDERVPVADAPASPRVRT